MVMGVNVRQKQKDALLRVLNFNAQNLPGKDPGEVYKVLVLDNFCKDVVAPLLRVNELRRHGVTLHLSLEADRQPIPDVPAIYLVQPTPANIDRIIHDFTQNLYESAHINFSSALPPRFLEQLAAGAVKCDGVTRIRSVFDQYLSFIALEHSLFSLGLVNTYVELNDPTARDTQIEAAVNAVVDGVFNVLVTLGVVPIIRCPRGGAAEAVASALDGRLRDALKARHNLFTESVGLAGSSLGSSLSRPLLLLLDRNFDLTAALAHSWTYKPLVQDTLGMRLNRVILSAEASTSAPGISAAGPAMAKRAYDVDDSDFFWTACGAHTFPKVAEEVETQLQRYKAAVDDINKQTALAAQDGAYDPDEIIRRSTQSLMSAVSSLPELQEQKKTLDKHTNLATALLGHIKSRALDQYNSVGEDLMAGKSDLVAVMKLLNSPRGTAADKLRLALLWLLTYEGLPSDTDTETVVGALKSAGAESTALEYVRSLKRNNLTGGGKAGVAPLDPGSISGGLIGSSQANLLDWADKTFGQGITGVTRSVKSLLAGGSRQAPSALVLEALMDARPGVPEFETYVTLDPRAPAGARGGERGKGPFKDAIVFVIGGGNYAERELLAAWAQRSTTPKHVIYGATELLSGEDFLAQLSELAKRSGIQA